RPEMTMTSSDLRRRRAGLRGLAMFVSLVAVACSDDPAPGVEPEEDPAADACEHFAEGPFNDVTAGADLATAPDVSASHTHHRITLADDGSGSYGGFVAIAADEAAEILLFL